MAGLYVDTSALGRLVLEEPDAPAIRKMLASYEAWWSSELIVVELRRLGLREGVEDLAESLLDGVQLLLVDSKALERASRLEPFTVRSLDAVHLEAAVTLVGDGTVDSVLTYDRQLQVGCAHHALRVESPEQLRPR